MSKTELADFLLSSIRREKTSKFTPFANKTRGIFAVLSILHEYEGEMTSGEIAKKLGLTTPRMAVALQTLSNKGYVKKEKSLLDARKTIVVLTDLGKEVYDRQYNQSLLYLGNILSVLDEKDLCDLERIARKLLKD